MWSWAQRGWTKSDNQEPENLDLIQVFYDYWNKGYRIDLRKCAGHAGNKWNETADKLARTAKEDVKKLLTLPICKFNVPNKNNTIITEESFKI